MKRKVDYYQLLKDGNVDKLNEVIKQFCFSDLNKCVQKEINAKVIERFNEPELKIMTELADLKIKEIATLAVIDFKNIIHKSVSEFECELIKLRDAIKNELADKINSCNSNFVSEIKVIPANDVEHFRIGWIIFCEYLK